MLKAPINFIALMDEKPTYHMDPPPGVPEENVTYEEHIVAIRNARQISPTASLDREGFELVNHQTDVSNLYDINAIHDTYYGKLETLVKQVTDAKRVVAFDWNIRRRPAGNRVMTRLLTPRLCKHRCAQLTTTIPNDPDHNG